MLELVDSNGPIVLRTRPSRTLPNPMEEVSAPLLDGDTISISSLAITRAMRVVARQYTLERSCRARPFLVIASPNGKQCPSLARCLLIQNSQPPKPFTVARLALDPTYSDLMVDSVIFSLITKSRRLLVAVRSPPVWIN